MCAYAITLPVFVVILCTAYSCCACAFQFSLPIAGLRESLDVNSVPFLHSPLVLPPHPQEKENRSNSLKQEGGTQPWRVARLSMEGEAPALPADALLFREQSTPQSSLQPSRQGNVNFREQGGCQGEGRGLQPLLVIFTT